MSNNTVVGGVRINRFGQIVHGNGELLTTDEKQALPMAIRKALKIKPTKSTHKSKVGVSKPGTFIKVK